MAADAGRLAGRTALITGAGRGIGEAVARRFAAEGAAVALADIDASGAEALAAELEAAGHRAVAIQADVREVADCERMAAEAIGGLGGVDTVVPCAAVVEFAPAHLVDPSSWDRVVDTNAKGTFLSVRALLPHLLERGSGTLVLFASVSATHGQPAFAAYNASKGAVLALTRNLAVDYGPAIRVNCVSPGVTDTPAVREAVAEAGEDGPALLAELEASNHVCKRLARPEEIAAAVLFLASDEASFCHGTNLLVAGGGTLLP